ncbi:MAG: hypothetical protein K9K93_06495 [Acholeplasmataceae bacterium]|nr:hypothetical protein [Acholeplasmataceae bacterium]
MRLISVVMIRKSIGIGLFVVCAAFLTAFSVHRYQELSDLNENQILAERMNDVLTCYFSDVGAVSLSAPEIRTLVNREVVFDFVPIDETSSFYYDLQTRKVVVNHRYELLNESDFGTLEPGSQLEEIIKGYLLLDQDGSELARTLQAMRNLTDERRLVDSESGLVQTMDRLGLGDHARMFGLDQAVYINDVYRLTTIESPIDSSKIIFCDDIEVIHPYAFNGIEMFLPDVLRLPLSVKLIEQGSFDSLDPFIKIIHDLPESLVIETNAFHIDDVRNSAYKDLEGVVTFQRLEIIIDFFYPVFSYFRDHERSQYLGKLVLEGDLSHIYGSDDSLIGSFDEIGYYDSRGQNIQAGETYEQLVYLRMLFSSSRFYTVDYDQNLTVRLSGDTEQEPVVISTFTTVFHMMDHLTIIEVKGFDDQGIYIARGTRVMDFRLFDNEDVRPSDPVFP